MYTRVQKTANGVTWSRVKVRYIRHYISYCSSINAAKCTQALFPFLVQWSRFNWLRGCNHFHNNIDNFYDEVYGVDAIAQ